MRNLLAVLILALIAAVGIFIYQKNVKDVVKEGSPINALSTQTSSPSPAIQESATPRPAKEVIEDAINSKTYADLLPYFVQPEVKFSLMSSECCQPQSPEEAVTQLKYIDEGVPFDFNQNEEIVKNIKTKKGGLKDAFIGVSKNTEQVAVFFVNAQNKITEIQLAVSWKLYDY